MDDRLRPRRPSPLHPILGLAPTFAWRLGYAARLRAAAARNSFRLDLVAAARRWMGGVA